MTLNAAVPGQPIVLIGKGVTFDSGGYNIKPTGHIETMHTDMAGAAAVLGTMQSLAILGEKKKVIAIIPSTENLISGDAYKPSDILTSMSGKTVEIGNTDAEGRLILADAVTYAKKYFDPKVIFDLATLTGACMVALGERYAGILSNEPRLIKNLEQASQDSGDKVWHLPLDTTFMDKMKSRIADLSNTAHGSPGAGASTGAAFIGHFAEKTPWAHIDIAGPSHQQKDIEAWNPSTGATGFGVALMTTLVQKYLR
jgi:leucyl aminopeptidase